MLTLAETVHGTTGIGVYFSWMFALAFSMPTNLESFGWIMVSHAVAGICHY